MRQATGTLELSTPGKSMLDVTGQIKAWVQEHGIAEGLLTVFCKHTSASLLIQENAAPEVKTDLQRFFEQIAPQDPGRYEHDDEGPDDMPAHIRTALTQVQLSIPIVSGRLALGRWQGIYLCEHRQRPHRRTLALHVIGA